MSKVRINVSDQILHYYLLGLNLKTKTFKIHVLTIHSTIKLAF